MYVYVLFGILSVLSILSVIFDDKRNRKIETIMLFLFLMFLAIQFPLGTDIEHYKFFFEQTPMNLLEAMTLKYSVIPNNKGFILLMWLIKNVINNFNVFIFIVKLLICTVIGYIVYKYSSNYIISMMIILGSGIAEVYMSNAFRQMLAMTVFLFAYYKFLLNDEYLKYYLCSILALSFHWMAAFIFVVPVVKMYYEKFKDNKIFSIFIPCISAIVLYEIETFVIPNFVYLIPGRFQNYFITNDFSLIGLLSRIAILLVVLSGFYHVDKSQVNNKEDFSVYLCFISFLIYVVFARSAIFSRVCDMISIIEIVLIPVLISNTLDKNIYRKLITLILEIGVNSICLFADVKFIADNSLNNHDLKEYPLYFVWDEINYKEILKDYKYE